MVRPVECMSSFTASTDGANISVQLLTMSLTADKVILGLLFSRETNNSTS